MNVLRINILTSFLISNRSFTKWLIKIKLTNFLTRSGVVEIMSSMTKSKLGHDFLICVRKSMEIFAHILSML